MVSIIFVLYLAQFPQITSNSFDSIFIMFPFSQDYIRAAQTCIKFYIGVSGKNTQVVDLIVRKEYLHNACKHFETALSVRNSGREVRA